MDYKTLMGYGKKKKQIKEETIKNKPTVLDNIKEELNEWSFSPPTDKRWSKSAKDVDGLTEFERKGGKDKINEGPAGDYEPYIHAIDQNYKKYWDSVKMFQKQLAKKGMKKEANNVHGFYTKLVSKFHSWFGKFVRKLM
jgi:hypothetical protein